MILNAIRMTCRLRDRDAKHFVFALHPLAKTLRFSSFFHLSLTAAWALEVGWSLCGLILSDGFALSSLLLQNENLGQSDLPKAETHLSVFTTISCISGSGFENSPVEFCEWRKEKKHLHKYDTNAKELNVLSKCFQRIRHFFIWLMNLYESLNVVIAALWLGYSISLQCALIHCLMCVITAVLC